MQMDNSPLPDLQQLLEQNPISIEDDIPNLVSPLLSPSDLSFLSSPQQPLPVDNNPTPANTPPTATNPPIPPIPIGRIYKKKKQQFSIKQCLEKQKKSEEASTKYSYTRNPHYQLNLNYNLKLEYNQWRIVFWDQSRQEFTLENPSLNYQRLTVPLRAISAFL